MSKTGYFSHADSYKHEMGRGHPECPARLTAIEDRLRTSAAIEGLVRLEAPLAELLDIALGHSPDYVQELQDMSERLREGLSEGGRHYAQLDPDTALNADTWDAIRRGTGATLAAVDAVMAGEIDNAFCAVRPPGHHACYDHGMGFCFFNNVAIAAKYALDRHGLERVAIVDFDVHHGNGTEDIVAGDDRIVMVSFYQHPFYPQGGSRSVSANMVNLPIPAFTAGDVIRPLIEQHWLPRLEAHRPELILISAGFDAHREDDLGQLGLVEADYAWITRQLKEVAKRHAKGRIVSSLEGGYNLSALGRSVEAHLRALAE